MFLDKVHEALGDKVCTYLTWTPDLRLGWKRKRGPVFVGCYVRWREKGAPPGVGPIVYFRSAGVQDFNSANGLAKLRPSYWKHYAGCRHYKPLNTIDDAQVASEGVGRLYELTAWAKWRKGKGG